MSSGKLRWSKISHRFLPLNDWYAEKAAHSIPVARSDLPCPMIISDSIEMKSMLDGQTYTSKRAYQDSLRRTGHEVCYGEDLTKFTAPTYDEKAHTDDIASDVKTAIEQIEGRL
jgi:hypothetical protein